MNSSTLWDTARQYSCVVARSCIVAAGLCVSSAIFAQSETENFQDLRVTVESGDTFSGILSRELKSLDAWGDVARYNKLGSPDNLKPGDVIVIPGEVFERRNYATAVFVKGKAIHHNAAEDTKGELKKGDKIYAGDLIETDEDGFVSVSFNGGTSVNIQPDSTMKIDVLKCTDRESACQIDLRSENGQLGLDVQSIGFEKPTEFNIDSPYASAAVRGTRFDFDVDEGNVLGVTEGTVQISLNGIRNDIKIGKGVLAGQGRSINDLYDLRVKPTLRLRDDINRISSEDIINWDAVDGAVKYLLKYSDSESMKSVLTSLAVDKTLTLPELPIGDFFIGARAVDENGLRGFTGVKKLQSVDIDSKVAAPELEILIRDKQMQITPSGSASDDVEVKIGNSIENLESGEYIVTKEVHHLKGGESITVEIDLAKQWFMQTRKVVDSKTVSPYGLLYFFDKADK